MLYKAVNFMNAVAVIGGAALAFVFIWTIWSGDGSLFSQPLIWQASGSYLIILILSGIVRRAAALERLMRPRVEDNGYSVPDGYTKD